MAQEERRWEKVRGQFRRAGWVLLYSMVNHWAAGPVSSGLLIFSSSFWARARITHVPTSLEGRDSERRRAQVSFLSLSFVFYVSAYLWFVGSFCLVCLCFGFPLVRNKKIHSKFHTTHALLAAQPPAQSGRKRRRNGFFYFFLLFFYFVQCDLQIVVEGRHRPLVLA